MELVRCNLLDATMLVWVPFQSQSCRFSPPAFPSHLSAYPLIQLSAYLPIHLSTYPTICLSTHLIFLGCLLPTVCAHLWRVDFNLLPNLGCSAAQLPRECHDSTKDRAPQLHYVSHPEALPLGPVCGMLDNRHSYAVGKHQRKTQAQIESSVGGVIRAQWQV